MSSNPDFKLRFYGDKILREKSAEIENPEQYFDFVKKMKKFMIEKGGIGLAAPQIGFSIQLLTVDNQTLLKEFPEDIKHKTLPDNLINPKIIYLNGEETEEEGCLSFPGLYLKISRPKYAVIEGITLSGNKIRKIQIEVKGYIARVFLHEIDHLNGILFIDRIAPEERKIILAQWIKILKQQIR